MLARDHVAVGEDEPVRSHGDARTATASLAFRIAHIDAHDRVSHLVDHMGDGAGIGVEKRFIGRARRGIDGRVLSPRVGAKSGIMKFVEHDGYVGGGAVERKRGGALPWPQARHA